MESAMFKLLAIGCIVLPNIAFAASIEYRTVVQPPWQTLAQKRIEAKAVWERVRPEIKVCIDDKLEIDGLTIVELISHGMLPSDNFIRRYREECFFEVLGKTKQLTPN